MRNKILIVLLIVILVGVGAYLLGIKNSKTIYPNNELKPYVPITNIPPYFSAPKADAKVSSPLTVRGVVPTGWMFEGNVPVKLLDEDRKVIAQAPGGEVNPGTWMDEEPDEFESTLTFTTSAKSGYLVVSEDDPRDFPQNVKTYEIPVRF